MASDTQLRVLVVEDSDVMRADLVQMLKAMGCEVVQAENGYSAWVLLQAKNHDTARRPEAILSDVNMPEMDGMQLLEKVRGSKDYATIPFVVLTANKEELLRMTALCLNVTAFFIKPPEKNHLATQLKKLFPKKKIQ